MRVLLLTAILFLVLALPGAAQALDYTAQCSPDGNTCVYDSNAAAWINAAAHWPGAGPIFDASSLVLATYSTFTVLTGTADTDIDATFMNQTVCYDGAAPFCPEPYYRGPLTFQEANSELWHMLFTQPVLGILFAGPSLTWETTEFGSSRRGLPRGCTVPSLACRNTRPPRVS